MSGICSDVEDNNIRFGDEFYDAIAICIGEGFEVRVRVFDRVDLDDVREILRRLDEFARLRGLKVSRVSIESPSILELVFSLESVDRGEGDGHR
ncbi:hypothetical protein Igag_1651 [Ignisphaera aggregans DSM 17230]|uniref:Uncharacterized protein n=1 Tax=Ignisphaera aggregans (strain DSM 17230 / JCM 13409 / AQ1.S1) TaxID=583356 RepID=E0SRR8_IGNAA|nr:hypothetical protein Igag_1651 [Ignisphaera aggregans DSM 17230]